MCQGRTMSNRNSFSFAVTFLTALTPIFAGALYAGPASADFWSKALRDPLRRLSGVHCVIKDGVAEGKLTHLIVSTHRALSAIVEMLEHKSQLDMELEGSNEMMATDPNAVLWLLNDYFQILRTLIERVSVNIISIEDYNGMAKDRMNVPQLNNQLEELRSILQGIQALGLSLSRDEFLIANRIFFEIAQSVKERLVIGRDLFRYELAALPRKCRLPIGATDCFD